MYMYDYRLRSGVHYKSLLKSMGINREWSTYYNWTHRGRMGNASFRQMLKFFNYDREFINCFELSQDQEMWFNIPVLE